MKVGIDQLIEVDQRTFEMVLTPLARNIRVFNDIIVRDKGSVGDSQGRKKQQAIGEIVYCYLMEKYGTPFYRWEEKKRHGEIVKRLKVEVDPDDPLIIECRKFISDSQITPSFEALTQMKETYHSVNNMVKVMRGVLQNVISDVQLMYERLHSSDPEDEDYKGIDEILDSIEKGDKILNKIKNNVKDFNNILTLIKDLEDKVKSELGDEAQVKGGGSVSKWER